MVEDVEKLPAKLELPGLVRHREQRGAFRQGRIDIGKLGPNQGIPAQIAVRKRSIGLKGSGIKELRNP
jgi:hypothetical protein